MPDWRETEERRVSIFSSPPASWTFAHCRARYMGNNSYSREVSQRLFLLCSGLPLQPEHPCLLTSSAVRQQPQIASIWSLQRESLRRRICPSSSGGRRFHRSRLAAMLPLPLLPCDYVQAWRVLFVLLDIIALPRHRRDYLSSPLSWHVATQTH